MYQVVTFVWWKIFTGAVFRISEKFAIEGQGNQMTKSWQLWSYNSFLMYTVATFVNLNQEILSEIYFGILGLELYLALLNLAKSNREQETRLLNLKFIN